MKKEHDHRCQRGQTDIKRYYDQLYSISHIPNYQKLKICTIIKYAQRCEAIETLNSCGNVNLFIHFTKQFSSKHIKTEHVYHATIPSLGINKNQK